MADGLNIPGVSDRYKTNDLVKALIEKERLPLTKEEEKVETYKSQQDAWRGMNQKMSTLRDSVKTLYSFENPFNNKLSSSDEGAVTVDAGREAEYGSFKLEVIQPAATDRFLSTEIDAEYQVKSGQYTFQVGEKNIDFNWKGGKLGDFVTALNKRGGDTLKASLIGVSADKKSLLIESLKTGESNRLIFKNKAFDFAKEIDMIGESTTEKTTVKFSTEKIYTPQSLEEFSQRGIPELSKSRVEVKNESEVDGEEVVQLYYKDKICKIFTPVRTLLDFKRVYVPANQSITVEFDISTGLLGYYNKNCEYTVDAGEFEFYVSGDGKNFLKIAWTVNEV